MLICAFLVIAFPSPCTRCFSLHCLRLPSRFFALPLHCFACPFHCCPTQSAALPFNSMSYLHYAVSVLTFLRCSVPRPFCSFLYLRISAQFVAFAVTMLICLYYATAFQCVSMSLPSLSVPLPNSAAHTFPSQGIASLCPGLSTVRISIARHIISIPLPFTHCESAADLCGAFTVLCPSHACRVSALLLPCRAIEAIRAIPQQITTMQFPCISTSAFPCPSYALLLSAYPSQTCHLYAVPMLLNSIPSPSLCHSIPKRNEAILCPCASTLCLCESLLPLPMLSL